MSITAESVKTPGDRELVIELLPSGMYKIRADGVGQPPKVSEERFTTLREAKAALGRYVADNAKALEQADFMRRRHPKKKVEEA